MGIDVLPDRVQRIACIGLAIASLLVQICCAPPLRAAASAAAVPMQCPLQRQHCGEPQRPACNAEPQLVARGPVKKFTVPAQMQPAAGLIGNPVAHAEARAAAVQWPIAIFNVPLRI